MPSTEPEQRVYCSQHSPDLQAPQLRRSDRYKTYRRVTVNNAWRATGVRTVGEMSILESMWIVGTPQ